MLVEGLKEIQFGVLLDLHAEIVQLLDRSIACKEIQRSRSERYDLQFGKADDCACDRNKIVDHIRQVFCIPHRILRNVCPDITEF